MQVAPHEKGDDGEHSADGKWDAPAPGPQLIRRQKHLLQQEQDEHGAQLTADQLGAADFPTSFYKPRWNRAQSDQWVAAVLQTGAGSLCQYGLSHIGPFRPAYQFGEVDPQVHIKVDSTVHYLVDP